MLLPTAGDGEVITAVTGTSTTLVLCTGTAIVAINTKTGQPRWQQDNQALLLSVSADGTMLYVPFLETPRLSSERGQSHTHTGVESVNLLSGVVQWQDAVVLKLTEMGTITSQYLSWISTDGTMTTWRLSDGRQLWQTIRQTRPLAFAIDAADQNILVQDSLGEVDALTLFDGHLQWKHAGLKKSINTDSEAIQMDDHAIYVVDGTILEALPHSGGRAIWSLPLKTPTQWDVEAFDR